MDSKTAKKTKSKMRLYFDESIHENCGFMIVAFVVCSHDPQEELRQIIQEYSDVDEFHSCERMDINVAQQNLRESFRKYIHDNCQWGVMIFPSSMRWSITEELVCFLDKLRETIKFEGLFFDKSLIRQESIARLRARLNCNSVTINCSKSTMGIQLADLVASNCGVRLKSHLTGKHKILTYGLEAGYPEGLEAELSWELWASLRYSMLKHEKFDMDTFDSLFDTKNIGYFISDSCDNNTKDVADKLFSSVYLGCIH